ncbi:type 2 periplasmic-binding domain-containing protein [Herbaspirillum autotrophicum]|uniref:hypothetical protein n=1 Tax=Herbaspirillum autotrophicum TaxID=180195 RepID=UPI00067D772C
MTGLRATSADSIATTWFNHPQLVAIPLDAPELVRPLLIVHVRGRSLSIAVQGMLELIHEKSRSGPVS